MTRSAADPSGNPQARPDGPTAPGPAGFAFISYVREDGPRVDQLQQMLEAAEVPVWRDTRNLWPGEDWRTNIRQAITDNALVFIACFSQTSTGRAKSYQNEEFLVAIDQLRQRRPGTQWLIPVRLDDCEIPELDIGGGRTLASLHSADLFGDRADEKTTRLVATIVRILEHPRTTVRWPRTAVGFLRRTAVIVPLIATVLLAIVAYALLRPAPGHPVLMTGSVACESGRPVINIWIAAADGQGDSGWAHLAQRDFASTSFPIGAKGTYSYLLPHGGSYFAHVGCGGTKGNWASSNYSPLISTQTTHLRCHDPVSSNPNKTVRGRCTIAGAP